MSQSRSVSKVDYDLGLFAFTGRIFDKPVARRNRMFDKEALDLIVKRQLENVPEHHTIATIAVVNKDGERFTIAYKPNDEWEVQGYVEHAKTTGLAYGASVMWSR